MAEHKDDMRRIIDAVKSFDDAMLVTRTADGELRARPMAVAEVTDDGHVRFATKKSSGKTDELRFDEHVLVSLQKDDLYVSLSGEARLTDDRGEIERVWKEPFRAWFPQGKDDPELVLIDVQPHRGELWDQTGGKKLKNLVAIAAAYATGREVEHPEETHAEARMS